MSKGVKPQEIPSETYSVLYGTLMGRILGYSLRAMAQGQEKKGPEILQEVLAYVADVQRKEYVPYMMQTLGITDADLGERPMETYQLVFDFADRVLGCKKLDWIREGPDSLVEIASSCWMMEAVKEYPEICTYVIGTISRAIREQMWPDLEMECLEMVPMGNAPDYCKVRVKQKKDR
jgi:hypothetical protein